MTSTSKIKVGIVGGTGYTGVELLRLLARHPAVEIVCITSRSEEGEAVADKFPSLRGVIDLKFSSPQEVDLTACDVVFFATPHGVAMSQAPQLLEKGVKLIDLAADFRLQDTTAFEKWYKMPHSCPDILKESIYGLPEINREHITNARVIANPGCYPTTVILGLMPLLKHKLLDETTIIADCKSGASGAGRGAKVANLFGETADSFRAYGVAGHRHHPEIVAQLNGIAGREVALTFVPHLVPMIRGMFSTIYVNLNENKSLQQVRDLYTQAYQNEPFVDVLPEGLYPDTRTVRASNQLRIAIEQGSQPQQFILLVVQDNLTKGASGQAVQNMNLMFGLPETTGLDGVPVLP